MNDHEPEEIHVHQAQLSDSRLDLKQSADDRPVIQVRLEQATCSGTEDDYWLKGNENSIIRVHASPRLSLFVPSPSDCPFPLNKLHEQRKTHVRWTQNSSIDAPDEYVYVDSWKGPDVSFKERWTGATVFTVMQNSQATSNISYPTESAIRQKQRKADGHVSVPRKKTVEQHQDDCGTSLSSIVEYTHSSLDQYEDDDKSYHMIDAVSQMFSNARANFYGSECEDVPSYWHQFGVMTMEEAFVTRSSLPVDDGLDAIELFGGKGQTIMLLAKYHGMKTGINFELLAGIDLQKESDIRFLHAYVDRNKPKVTIMAPPCKGYSKWGHLNKRINYEAWIESRKLSVPLARLSGDIAIKQVKAGRHYLVEQPQGSGLYQEPQWKELESSAHKVILDQCMVGLAMQKSPHWPVRKTTEIWASDERLVMYLQNLRCDGSHPHAHIGSWSQDGHPTVRSSDMQVWPLELCERIAAGVSECVMHMQSQRYVFAFPEAAAGEVEITCPGCRGHIRREDPRHDRGPGCKFRDVEAMVWECDGCKHHRHRNHPSHTNGPDCRWSIARTVGEGASAERGPRHPRDGRVPAFRDPTAELRLERREDGVPGEVLENAPPDPEVLSPDEAERRRADKAASSGEGGGGGGRRRSEASVQVEAPRAILDRQDAAAGVVAIPEDRHDAAETPSWSRYDLGFALQQLRSIREGVVRRMLRKLHIRWFHASSKRMMTLLEAAGVSKEVILLIPSIIDTCSVCRNWQRTGPRTVTSMRVPESFNQEVQIDLLFYKTHIILHSIDACTRWSAVAILPNRESHSILSGFCSSWLRIFGPPQNVLTDQEGGLVRDEVAEWFSNKDIQLSYRAKNQHCTMVERHNEILRRQLHLIEDQTNSEGFAASFDMILSEAVFAKNALFQVGNSSPYQALFGRVPPLLSVVSEESGEPITDREASRLRQIAISTMIQATAEQKARIASQTKTRRAGELLELELNDMVDFYRKPITKDGHGWIGPAQVVNLTSMKDGMLHVKWQGRIIAVRIADVRRSLLFPVFLTRPTGPVRVFKEEVENHIGLVTRVGWIQQGSHWSPCQANGKFAEILSAGLYVASVCMQLDGVIGFRFGTSVQSLTAVNFDDTLLLWWQVGKLDEWSHSYMTGTRFISLSKMIGECENIAVAQFFMVDRSVVSQVRSIAPEVSHLGGVLDPSMPRLRDMTDDIDRRSRQKTIEEHQVPETDDNPVSPRLDTPGPLIEEVPTSNASSTVEEHFVESNYVFDSVSVAASECFSGATYLSNPPPVNVCGLGEVTETLERNVIDADVPEIEFEPGFTNYLVLPNNAAFKDLAIKESRIVFVYEQGKTPFAVIEREHNILTRDEALANAQGCKESMLEELMRWIKHDAWRRGPRNKAVNILKSKWVLKWKIMDKDGVKQRRIKSRLVAQGFQDKQETPNYAGTTTRWGQRLLIIVSVQFGWSLWSADISEAFLRGLTFEELQHENQGVLRQVEISLPPGGEHLIRTLPGYEDFCAENEVLFLRKPGFGLKDAPRLWLLALKRVLTALGAVPTNVDPQLYAIHKHGKLQLLMSVHVDDIKLCGEKTIMEQTIRKLESHFDALKLEKENFLHLGLQHTTLKDGSISVSQTHYINELREIPEDKLKLQDKQEPADDEFKQYFMSLLGGLAWCVQTRIDIAIFVGALQRKLQNPSVEDILNLNRVLRYVKVKPLAMHFKRINNPWRLVAISDSGFKGEGQDHLAIRSGIIALVDKEFPKLGVNDIQIIEYISKKQTRICRSTYSAELFSCLDVCGLAQNVSMAITEILQGTMTATALSDTLEAGKLALELDVVIDAAAVYENLIVEETKLKTPSDVGMLIHALKMKELLKRNQVSRLIWTDTRSMLADGLNKGSVSRDALRRAAGCGEWEMPYENKIHREPLKEDQSEQAPSTKCSNPQPEFRGHAS